MVGSRPLFALNSFSHVFISVRSVATSMVAGWRMRRKERVGGKVDSSIREDRRAVSVVVYLHSARANQRPAPCAQFDDGQ